MRKVLVSLILVAGLAAGGAVFAQAPTPCNAPLLVKDVLSASITTTRSMDLYGWYFQLRDDPTSPTVSFGYLYDNQNVFINGSASAAKGFAIKAWTNHEAPAIQAGDSLNLTIIDDGDGTESGTIYLPAMSADTLLYIGSDWRAYTSEGGCHPAVVTSPTPTPSPSATVSPVPSFTPTPTATVSPVPSFTPTPSVTPTAVPSASPSTTPTPSPSATVSPVPTATPTAVPSVSPVPSQSPTPSPTVSPVPTPSPSPVPSKSPSPVPTPSVSPFPSPSPSPSAVPSPSPSPAKEETTSNVIGSQMIYGRSPTGWPINAQMSTGGYLCVYLYGVDAAGTPRVVRTNTAGFLLTKACTPSPVPSPSPSPTAAP